MVIRPGALGDALLAFPVLQALKQRASPEKVLLTLVSNPAILELAQDWDIAKRTDNYSATRWSELFSTKGICSPALAEEIAQTDLAICWLHDSDGLVGRNLRAAGCQQVIVAPGRPDDAAQPIHIVDYLGHTLDLKVDKMLPFKLASGLTPLQQARQEVIVDTQQKMVAIHPGSGGARKCWPIERFARVIQELQQRHIPILLLSGPADGARIERLRDLLGQTQQGFAYVRLLENVPLNEILHEFLNCCCYLGNDAGMTHLAALFGLPTIVLFGPSNPATWQPVGDQVYVIYEPQLELLGENAVMQVLCEHFPKR
jgi:heptosyltransferase-3